MLNVPEAHHGTAINAVHRAGHALRHSCLHELVVKCPVGILDPLSLWNRGRASGLAFTALSKVL